MEKMICILGTLSSDALKIFSDIMRIREKCAVYPFEYFKQDSNRNIFISKYSRIIEHVDEGEAIEIWIYYDILGALASDNNIDKRYIDLYDFCGKALSKGVAISIHLILRGNDVRKDYDKKHLAGGIWDKRKSWEKYYSKVNALSDEKNIPLYQYFAPYVIDFPWNIRAEESITKRIRKFIQFVSERFVGYSDMERYHIVCNNRGWIKFDYLSWIDHLCGKSDSVEMSYYSLEELVNKLHITDKSIVVANDEERMSFVDNILNDLILNYCPYINNSNLYFEKIKKEVCVIQNENSICTSFQLMKKSVHVNESEITYFTAGAGEAILIINAYGVKVDVWRNILYELSRKYKVIISEIRGVREYEKPLFSENKAMGLYDQVDDLCAIIDNEKDKSIHIISWCSGAKQAIMIDNMKKYNIISQTIIAGEYAPYSGSKMHHSKFRKSVQEIYSLVKDNDRIFDFYMNIINQNLFTNQISYAQDIKEKTPVAIEEFLFSIIPNKVRPYILYVFESKELMRNFLAMCVEYYQHTIEGEIEKIETPVLLLSAERDQTASPEQSVWAAGKNKNIRHVCLPAATHLMIIDRYEDILSELLSHLEFSHM